MISAGTADAQNAAASVDYEGDKMRSPLLVVVSTFLLPWSGFAQVPSVVESDALQAGPHDWRKVLRNQGTSSLVAYTVGCIPKTRLSIVSDALIDGGSYVDPGKSIEAQVNDPSTCEAGVHAAIFSDGHTEGDPKLVQELFAYRRGAYQALGDTIKLLTSVYTQHVATADIIDKLKAERKATFRKMTQESVGYNTVLFQISGVLSEPNIVWRSPPEYQGQKQQLSSIEDVMTANGLSRDEARVMLLNKRLEAWKSLLENNLQPRQ